MGDPPEALAQPEGAPQNLGLPNRHGRFTRSRQGGPKRAASGRTPRHRGRTQAGFEALGGVGGGSAVAVGMGRSSGAGSRTRLFRWSLRLGVVVVVSAALGQAHRGP